MGRPKLTEEERKISEARRRERQKEYTKKMAEEKQRTRQRISAGVEEEKPR